ncbi:MAG: hypothetical protein QOI11_297, partial [Candidatus Eremiobacteraeota bacterium]|nr:hypothetical protein [Candidatus Eremiobacteraeota bacterium]
MSIYDTERGVSTSQPGGRGYELIEPPPPANRKHEAIEDCQAVFAKLTAEAPVDEAL